MKRIFYITILSICLVCLFSGCNKERIFSDDVSGVGGTLTKNEKLIDESDMDAVAKSRLLDPGLDANDIEIKGQKWQAMNAEYVKKLFQEYATNFTKQNGESDNVTVETAPLSKGGTLKISTYADTYSGVLITYPENTGADAIVSSLQLYITKYIERNLTDIEKQELTKAVSAAKSGAQSEYVEALRNTAQVEVSHQNSQIEVTMK